MCLVWSKNIVIMSFDYTVSYTIVHQESEPEIAKDAKYHSILLCVIID